MRLHSRDVSQDVRPGGYEASEKFRADLDAIAASFRADGAKVVTETHVDPLRRTVETFGFTLASLDLRDHRKNHTAAVAALLDREGIDYRGHDKNERVAVLTEAILQEERVVDIEDREEVDEEVARVCELCDRLAD